MPCFQEVNYCEYVQHLALIRINDINPDNHPCLASFHKKSTLDLISKIFKSLVLKHFFLCNFQSSQKEMICIILSCFDPLN